MYVDIYVKMHKGMCKIIHISPLMSLFHPLNASHMSPLPRIVPCFFLPFCLSAFLPFCLSSFLPFCLSAKNVMPLSHRHRDRHHLNSFLPSPTPPLSLSISPPLSYSLRQSIGLTDAITHIATSVQPPTRPRVPKVRHLALNPSK